jgi:pantoate--beta-alanine ligase
MKIVTSPREMQKILKTLAPPSIGFVPTMGALHEGHLSLVQKSREQNLVTVVSIFVNPTQFNNPEDLEKYPRTIEQDQKMLKDAGADYLFLPNAQDMYGDQFNYTVTEKEKNTVLCGASRPGHFAGVLTVVLKLLNIVQPTRAYFGEKDFQQLEIIRGMVDAFFLPIEIVNVPTQRDEMGLALSSRNKRLSPEGIEQARQFAQILKKSTTPELAKQELEARHIPVDYLEDRWGRRFAAVNIENVRLIDNVPLS